MSTAKETEFKGLPLLALSRSPEDRFPFQFGVLKAKLILEHVADIMEFYNKYKDKTK
jgi:hypothetical protein